MIINRIISFLIIHCSFVYGACQFYTDADKNDLNEKIQKWNIDKTFTKLHNGSIYTIGVCQSLDNTSAAIIQKTENLSFVLGRLDVVNVIVDDNWILFTYRGGDQFIGHCNNNTRDASLLLVCGPNKNNLTVLQDASIEPHCNFMFKLQVPEMCPTVQKNNKLSGGAIFLIILFSLTTVYLVAGAVFMHVKRGARGLEHIPNLEMWRRLGNLAADGCDFCCRCERPNSRAGYFLQASEVDMPSGDDDILSP